MANIGLAHRGYPKKVPENTLPSFQAALDLQFSHLELDVNMTKDGVPVVIHDPTVDRTTNGSGYVKDFTLQELQQLQTAEGEPVPTLEEVLRLAKGRATVDIELKQSGNLYPGMEERVLQCIRDCGMMDQVFVTSFDHYSIIRLRELDPDIDLGYVIYGATPSIFPLAKETRARYVSVKYIYLTDEFVRRCEDNGLQIIAWTVDDEAAMKQLMQVYPNVWICTNELERWKNSLQELQQA